MRYARNSLNPTNGFNRKLALGAGAAAFGMFFLFVFGWIVYQYCRIDVPKGHIAVLVHYTGKDLENDMEVAPDPSYKGLQLEIKTEGRYYVNPFYVGFNVYPAVEVPEGYMGVRTRLYGDDLPYGHFMAKKDTDKGIVEDVLVPGRHFINALVLDENGVVTNGREDRDYVEIVRLYKPVTIHAGFRGVVTNLAGPMPEDPNVLLVEKGFRGVQKETLGEGTYYLNPCSTRIEAIDCRSIRADLSEEEEIGFPSKDGFWISLDGIIEFSVDPARAAEVYVLFNDIDNDEGDRHDLADEIKHKIIMPNARSFCRLRGSDATGRDMIGGETRVQFQTAFEEDIRQSCEKEGIVIVQAMITDVNPPQQIAQAVRDRQVLLEQSSQYVQEKARAEEEAALATETAMIEQKKRLVEADREYTTVTTEALKEQEVALEAASRDLQIAKENLTAATDKAAGILAQKKSEAAIVQYENEAFAAGWRASVVAMGGDGNQYARNVLYGRIAPGYKSITVNTADSPLMSIFQKVEEGSVQIPLKPEQQASN